MASRPLASRPPRGRVWVQPSQTGRRKKRFRWARRIFTTLAVLTVLALAGWLYILHVYAPGLEREARTIPARVLVQMRQHNAPYIPIRSISPNLQHAIISVEDRRFYLHPGVDPLGLIRAFWVDLTQHPFDQGGSTLEQQLVKRAIVYDDRTVHAKLREIALAWAVDRDFPKWKVLEMYLNDAYYGRGAYGPQQAAEVYFGTDSAHLTVAQAAFLAALPQLPTIYGAHPTAPIVHQRWLRVLQDMESQGYITAQQQNRAQSHPLRFAFANP